VALNLYLDDCANSDLVALLLTQAGHAIVRPAEAGIAWEDDDVHFQYAKMHHLVLITKNPRDFRVLHNQDQDHAGIFAVYQDNDPTRDMTQADIVAAIEKIEAAVPHGHVIEREFHNLNAWR
jgi:hypothetical protein